MSTTVANGIRWATDEEGGRGEATPPGGHAHSPPEMSPAHFFLEGPGRRLTSAIQLMSSALNANNNAPSEPAVTSGLTSGLTPSTGAVAKTIVAADNEVSNGFVKDGKMLPYVFEASDSGEVLSKKKIFVKFNSFFSVYF